MARTPANNTAAAATGRPELSTRALLRLFIPLSLSDMMMILAAPVISAGLARLPDPQLNLAAYGAGQSMAILIESPVIMLLQASTVAAANPAAMRTLWRLMIGLCISETTLFALAAFTPAFFWIFGTVLGLPPDMQAATRLTFTSMLLWPAAIAWRRYHQGYLIYHRQGRSVAAATLWRLASVCVVVALGVWLEVNGARLAGVANQVGVIVESAVVTAYFWLFRRRQARAASTLPMAVTLAATPAATGGPAGSGTAGSGTAGSGTAGSGTAGSGATGGGATGGGVPVALGALVRWYLPLAFTMVLVWVTRPLLSAGIARAAVAEASLAVWPVTWSVVSLLSNSTRMVQQLVISLVHDRESYQALRAFTARVATVAVVGLGIVAFTPLGTVYLVRVIGVNPALAALALPALQLSVLYPAMVAMQNWYQALLVRRGSTGHVNAAAFGGGAFALALVFVGAYLTPINGALLAAGCSVLGMVIELAILHQSSAPARQGWLLAAPERGRPPRMPPT